MEKVAFNKTKIVATVGPASSSKEMLRALAKEGVDVFRLNFSHGTHEDHQKVINNVREINKEMGSRIALLQDLQGPKIRVNEMKEGTILKPKETLIITTRELLGDHEIVSTSYQGLPNDVKPGDMILIDDGKIELKVIEARDIDVVTEVVYGGLLKSRKGINLPFSKVSAPSLTEKDLKDLEFGLKNNMDWVALSFVRKAKDIDILRGIIEAHKSTTRIIAKIEKPEALDEIDHIINETDALMVARGDLGVELPMEEVPLIQKMLVNKCIQASKPVIIATQMMESMISNYTPTRAEVNDVANSVIDGADALMLSGETSVGLYPIRVVEHMRTIISKIESQGYRYNRFHLPEVTSETFISDSVCYNACVMASQVAAHAIVGITRSGYTAYKVSSQRPNAHIYIFTDIPSMLNVLNLVWGVHVFYYSGSVSTDDTISELQEILKLKGYVNSNDIIVNLASVPIDEQGRTNMIKLGRVK